MDYDEKDYPARLRRLAKSLQNSLSFAAPEIWAVHIMDSLGAAFDLGRESEGAVPRGEEE